MDRGAHRCSQVAGAEGKPSQAVVTRERRLTLDDLYTLDEALQDLADIATILKKVIY